LKLFPLDVFYNEHSITNIIALFDLIKRVPGIIITLDSREDPSFSATFYTKLYYFAPFRNGLYYFDTRVGPRSVNNIKSNTKCSPYSLMQTVADNKKFYTAQKIKGAENARLLQEKIGWPSDGFYKQSIKEILLTNTEITIDYLHRADHIFGSAKPLLQGTMIRQKPNANKIEKYPYYLYLRIIAQSVSAQIFSRQRVCVLY